LLKEPHQISNIHFGLNMDDVGMNFIHIENVCVDGK
jgi:hypothetical protein